MDREIKFRAWNALDKEMVYFDLSNIYGCEGEVQGVILPDEKAVLNFNSGYGKGGFNDDLKIMQYTGLKDENGKELYHGDIYIKWGEVYQCDFESVIYEKLNCTIFDCDFEVIGNIYESPDLLEVGK